MLLKSIKILGATAISVLFVMIGIYLFNLDKEYTFTKIIGLINIIFFGCFAILGLYATVKNVGSKR